MKKNTQIIKALLLDIRKRNAGSMTSPEGNQVNWDEADIIYVIPEGTTKGAVIKYTIHPKAVKEFYAKTSDICWGALVAVEIDNGQAVNIDVLADPFNGNLEL